MVNNWMKHVLICNLGLPRCILPLKEYFVVDNLERNEKKEGNK